MTDINDQPALSLRERRAKIAGLGSNAQHRETSESDLIGLVEWLFFAYRDFISDPDADLGALGFGRAHHRVLHFVNRHPGLRVADLLDILKITKQSLGRVLKQLIDQDYIAQQAGRSDRRERRLYPTQRGQDLARQLIEPQLKRIAGALAAAGEDGEAARDFLRHMVGERERGKVDELIGRGQPPRRDDWTAS